MIFTKPRKDCEQFRTQNTTNIWQENINARAYLYKYAKIESPNRKTVQKIYGTLSEINNFCINDLFHEYNCKLHDRLTIGTNFWDTLYFSRMLLFQVKIKSGLIFPT